MSAEDQQHHDYSGHHDHHYEQQQEEQDYRLNRPIFSHTDSTDSINSAASYHSQHQDYNLSHPVLLPQEEYNKSELSPQRMDSMSSQPTTPKPSSATATTIDTGDGSPTLEQQESTTEDTTPTTTPLPLEQQQQQSYVTPVGTPTAESYSPHTNTIRTTSHRKDSTIPPNINETCPSFGATEYNHNIISVDRHSVIDVRLHTKVDRGFFLAEDDWTCYRRNYFQVSGSFSLEGIGILYEGQEFPCLAKDNHTGQLEEIHCFLLGVSARLSDCEKSIQLIQHTPKRDKGPQTTPTPKPIRPGGNIGFSAVGSSQSIVTFERLQFKTATANNGKRRAAQQYYVIIVELLAKLRNGNTVQVASTKSSSLVVRGRSPGHYAETDSGANPHTVTPRQHRASATSTNSTAQNMIHPPPPPPPQPQQHHHVASATAGPYSGGRPSPYTGTSTNMFQSTEYMPYDYHGVAYANYGHMPPPPQHPSQQQQQHQQQYPNNTNSGHSSPVPMMAHHHQPQQHHYMNDAGSGRPSPSPSSEYPNHHQHHYEPHHDVKEEHSQHNSSPYYWQRNHNGHNGHEDQHHEDQQQEHWNRMRMASNNSTSTDHSHGSPYVSHPHQQQEQHSGYYAHQQHHPYGAPHPAAPYGHPSSHPGLPPPPTNGDHYQGYSNYAPASDWQQQRKTVYSYESDARGGPRQQEYEGNHNNRTPTINSPEQQKQTTVVK